LPGVVRAPVIESTNEVGLSLIVHFDFKSLKLRDGFLKHRTDATKPRFSDVLRLVPDPLKDVSSKGVVLDRSR